VTLVRLQKAPDLNGAMAVILEVYVLQCVAVWCNVLQCIALFYNVCSVLQYHTNARKHAHVHARTRTHRYDIWCVCLQVDEEAQVLTIMIDETCQVIKVRAKSAQPTQVIDP